MALNIKNREAHKLARELAELTGQSMTAVVLEALRQERKRLRRRLDMAARYEELMAIGQRCAQHIHNEGDALSHGNLLFDDERGMPA